MHLAPLNYDRFFKKVFSDTSIAKRFLEDFLDATITEIEQLGDSHRITDDSAIVEFDYRCKIDGKYIIVDMQQWYKPDVVKRFYLYHSLNSGLQLESLGSKIISETKSYKKNQKDYSSLEPVYTLIWMVDDNLHFSGDYAEFSLQHQSLPSFIADEELWFNADINEISSRREEVVAISDNQFKDVNFLAQNKLVFMFQKNIVKNMINSKGNTKYEKWFDFALKTRNKENIVDDFVEFHNDEIFAKIIRRLRKDDLNNDDIKYIESEDENIRLILDFYDRQNKLIAEAEQEARSLGLERGMKQGIEQERIKNIKGMIDAGLSINQVSKIIGLSATEINRLVK